MMNRRWKFAIETDSGDGYLLVSGDLVHDPDAAEDWIGTSRQADAEALRRVDLYEGAHGSVINRIVYESQGRA